MSLGNRLSAELRGDRVIWMVVALLAMFSILSVYSATGSMAFKVSGGNTEAYLMKHGLILGLGLLFTYVCYVMHYMRYKQAAPWLMVIAIPMLIYTLALGQDINEARRWIEVPFIGITFQTSDFAKLALIIFVAREITRHKDYIDDYKRAFLPIIVPIVIICALIAPADLSTAMLLFTTSMLMMFIGRVGLQYIGLLIILGLVVFSLLIFLSEAFPDVIRVDTWSQRLDDFVNKPEGGDQLQHAKMAIARGEFFGVGPGNSQMRNFLHSSYSDFIYAIICEEYGMVGALVILSLYVLLFFRTTALVTKSPKAFGALVAMGLSLNLVMQALANMAVSVHLVPVTGLTLPLISMGGTSLLFTCIAFGIILSVSKYIEQVNTNESGAPKTEESA
ncbi:MAG: FtsW/RodA/SpoVE family cell cycle protein [Phaeodactylibacter sp.]|nr:FtsW/RodA/SpoVE family cell cycle protein [Phaeodactylibacter sp.]